MPPRQTLAQHSLISLMRNRLLSTSRHCSVQCLACRPRLVLLTFNRFHGLSIVCCRRGLPISDTKIVLPGFPAYPSLKRGFISSTRETVGACDLWSSL